MRRAVLIVAALLLIAWKPAPATTWHVLPDSTGDAPTIQAAIDSSSGGDTVLVAPGTYYVNLHIFQKPDLILASEGGRDVTILDGDPAYSSQYRSVIRVFSSPGVVVEGFTIQGARVGMVGTVGGGIEIGDSNPVIRDNMIRDNRGNYGGGIGFRWSCASCAGSVIENNSFIGNRATEDDGCGGVYLSFVGGTVGIRDNYFEGNTGEFGAIYGYLSKIVAEDNACLRNSSMKWCIYASHAISTVTRNLVAMDMGAGIVCNGGEANANTVFGNNLSGLSVFDGIAANNLVIGNREGITCYESALSCNNAWSNSEYDYDGLEGTCDSAGVNGNISADPLFCNPDADDYSIASESPCAPENSGGCGLIGALPVGCTVTSVPAGGTREPVSWGSVKKLFR
ncbi:MAG: hypothetical protein ABIK65_00010 [Candidatus Eisenbacteria bacterium]